MTVLLKYRDEETKIHLRSHANFSECFEISREFPSKTFEIRDNYIQQKSSFYKRTKNGNQKRWKSITNSSSLIAAYFAEKWNGNET